METNQVELRKRATPIFKICARAQTHTLKHMHLFFSHSHIFMQPHTDLFTNMQVNITHKTFCTYMHTHTTMHYSTYAHNTHALTHKHTDTLAFRHKTYNAVTLTDVRT